MNENNEAYQSTAPGTVEPKGLRIAISFPSKIKLMAYAYGINYFRRKFHIGVIKPGPGLIRILTLIPLILIDIPAVSPADSSQSPKTSFSKNGEQISALKQPNSTGSLANTDNTNLITQSLQPGSADCKTYMANDLPSHSVQNGNIVPCSKFSPVPNAPAQPLSSTEDSPVSFSSYLENQPWLTITVEKGDTISQIFARNGLAISDAYAIVKLEQADALLKIHPGQILKIKPGPDGHLGLLHYSLSLLEILEVKRSDPSSVYEVNIIKQHPETRIRKAWAYINQNLLDSSIKTGISIKLMYEFIAIFGGRVNFSIDMQPKDRFSIIYEELYLNDNKLGDGQIIAAELVVSGKKHQAIRYINSRKQVAYYNPSGEGLKSQFLHSPLDIVNITSDFSESRFHPIKQVWKEHRGVDYGAPLGTPVKTTANGTVIEANSQAGYGKTVRIQHDNTHETLYAHLNGFAKGIRRGVRVNQGETIGYVGRTGLATGPHLHYEFRVNGKHVNPVMVDSKISKPIEEKYIVSFKQLVSVWKTELDNLSRISLAQKN